MEKNKHRINVDKLIPNTWLKIVYCMIGSGLLRALSVHCFIVPAALAPGGVSGIASILFTLNPFFAVGWTMLIINIPLMMASYKVIGKKFTLVTFINILIMSLVTECFSWLNVPVYDGGDLLFVAIISGVLTSGSLFLMFSVGGSTGGTDVMALLLQKRFNSTNVSWLIFIVDSIIAISGLVCFDTVEQGIPVVFYSFVSIFACAKVLEILLNGLSSAVAFYIITEKKTEVSNAIFENLKRGCTAIEARGAYTNRERSLLLVVIRRRQVAYFKALLKSVDSDAFVYSTNAREVIGQGFSSALIK